ncbi:hypothetical protein KDK_19810 [Dictyobacter kobayashii]|uniref:Uncharacterized protein n=1 Tax=Dictyobacter kobayashii TaxID=2014872 RepID=A0A402AGD2_9CHLR|nr:hypothetical protein KDK_19810 [Dictyobacter kobayashii]
MRLITGKKAALIWFIITIITFAVAYVLRIERNMGWSQYCFYIGILTLIIAFQAFLLANFARKGK